MGTTSIQGDIDGESKLVVFPTTFRPSQEGTIVRAARMELLYAGSAVSS